jgi:hypothetical protein
LEQLLVQIESLMGLLVLRDDSFLQTSNEGDPEVEERQFGMVANLHQSINIEFSPYVEVKKVDENKDMIDDLRELKRELITSKLVRLVAIEKTISKRSDKLFDTLKEIIDMKARATSCVIKLNDLKIINGDENEDGDSDESDESDAFLDVEPKKDLESYIPKSMHYEYGLEPIDPKELENSNRFKLTDEVLALLPVPVISNIQVRRYHETYFSILENCPR